MTLSSRNKILVIKKEKKKLWEILWLENLGVFLFGNCFAWGKQAITKAKVSRSKFEQVDLDIPWLILMRRLNSWLAWLLMSRRRFRFCSFFEKSLIESKDLKLEESFLQWFETYPKIVTAVVVVIVSVAVTNRCQRGIIIRGIRVQKCIVYQRIVQSHYDRIFNCFSLTIAYLFFSTNKKLQNKTKNFFVFLQRSRFLIYFPFTKLVSLILAENFLPCSLI